jgi:hypothetical protein
MTPRDAADYLHCHPQTIGILLRKHAIPASGLVAVGGSGVGH